ncbi:polyprenyl synthetase family protein [Brachybacterium tyrofermentans]|uniref:polyprenyl synthetase family protein n=1 Tax=Brachybacterium tyrofermentans TaxID=47848 RepID=UPI001867C9C3|nr:polyprenyl synthetase family protein [Brachybacterium tyrofermentans]
MSARDHGAVDREIARLLRGGAPSSTADHRDLWDAFARAADGGKRFRPALLAATHGALGGVREEAAIQVAAALELLHTAFVVQDDVIDGDPTRRGVPSLPGSFAQEVRRHGASAAGARRYGDAAGILAGDLGLLAAFRAIARCEAPAPVVDRLLDLVESTVHASAVGELADVRLQLNLRPGLEPDQAEQSAALRDALAVAEFKTAVYSFQFPLHAGALLADADDPTLAALDEIGGLLGIGFQLFDDLLGLFGEERRTGKSTLGDLREGKRTALIAHATTTAQWPQLQPLLGRPDLEAEDARRARTLLTDSGSRAWTEELARWHLTSAVSSAIRHRLPAALVHALSTATEEILRTADLMLPSQPPSTPGAGSDPTVAPSADRAEKDTSLHGPTALGASAQGAPAHRTPATTGPSS